MSSGVNPGPGAQGHVPPAQKLPYWSLSGFYFTYFALLGATFPFWSLYLEYLGFKAVDIGLLLAIPMVTKIIAPGIWGWLADYTGKPLKIIRWGTLLGCFSFSLVFLGDKAWNIGLAIFLYSFFWNAVLPQQEVVTLAFLQDKPQNYSRIRVWGSFGFIVTVIGCGAWFDRAGVGDFPLIGVALLLCIWLSSLLLPDVDKQRRSHSQDNFLSVCRQPAVLSFLVAGCLLQVSHGVYYSFYSIYLEGAGYSRSCIGLYWSVGVIAEVVVFMLMHRALLRLGIRAILLGSLFIAFVRWLLIGHFVNDPVVLFIAQIGHAFTYGSFHAAAIETIRRLFGTGHQGKGQAIYSGLSFGLGGALGSVVGGLLWNWGPVYSYDFAAVASFMAFLIVFCWLKSTKLV